MIANVTYGYTSASFSGRMPCAEVADAIVQFGRETLESAIRTIEASEFDGRKPQVIYGDTDSLFVRCPGFSREEAFQVGKHLSSVITAQHPYPVKLAFEKVFHPCVLVTKKRYVGYSWESPDQKKPIFLAKGIESVRRDACPLVQETLDECLHSIFVNRSLTELKANLEAKFFAFARDPESFLDKCVVAKEVRPHYKDDRLLPPAAVVAGRLRCDPTYSARSGDRTPYLILERQSDLGEKLNERAVHPIEYVNYALGSGVGLPRIDVEYYLSRQVVPSLDRILGLAGFSVKSWYEASIRHRINRTLARPRRDVNNGNQHHIDRYLTSHGISLAGSDEAARDIVQHSSIEQSTRAVCLGCAGGQAEEESCISVNCPVWWVRSVHRVALNAWDASLLEW
jgi:DNA polymerase zeta